MDIVDEMLSRYPRETEAEKINALREVMPEIASACRIFSLAKCMRCFLGNGKIASKVAIGMTSNGMCAKVCHLTGSIWRFGRSRAATGKSLR